MIIVMDKYLEPCSAGCECDKHNKNGRVGKFPIICLHCGKVTFKPKFCDRSCSNNYNWSEAGSRFEHKKAGVKVKKLTITAGPVDSRGRVLKGLKCPPGCTCGKHIGSIGRRKDKVPSSPCRNCGRVRMVFPCQGSGMHAEVKFCDRDCFTEHQQKQMTERRATGDARKYDMKPREHQARMVAQGGKCAICSKDIIGKDAHRDHCHVSGQWRGLLCSNCNLGLGNFQDDADILLRAAYYLKNGGVDF